MFGAGAVVAGRDRRAGVLRLRAARRLCRSLEAWRGPGSRSAAGSRFAGHRPRTSP